MSAIHDSLIDCFLLSAPVYPNYSSLVISSPIFSSTLFSTIHVFFSDFLFSFDMKGHWAGFFDRNAWRFECSEKTVQIFTYKKEKCHES